MGLSFGFFDFWLIVRFPFFCPVSTFLQPTELTFKISSDACSCSGMMIGPSGPDPIAVQDGWWSTAGFFWERCHQKRNVKKLKSYARLMQWVFLVFAGPQYPIHCPTIISEDFKSLRWFWNCYGLLYSNCYVLVEVMWGASLSNTFSILAFHNLQRCRMNEYSLTSHQGHFSTAIVHIHCSETVRDCKNLDRSYQIRS